MLGYIHPGSMATMGAGVGIPGTPPLPTMPALLIPSRRHLGVPTYGRAWCTLLTFTLTHGPHRVHITDIYLTPRAAGWITTTLTLTHGPQGGEKYNINSTHGPQGGGEAQLTTVTLTQGSREHN